MSGASSFGLDAELGPELPGRDKPLPGLRGTGPAPASSKAPLLKDFRTGGYGLDSELSPPLTSAQPKQPTALPSQTGGIKAISKPPISTADDPDPVLQLDPPKLSRGATTGPSQSIEPPKISRGPVTAVAPQPPTISRGALAAAGNQPKFGLESELTSTGSGGLTVNKLLPAAATTGPQLARPNGINSKPLNQDEAAVKIQSSYRGYQTRKQIANTKYAQQRQQYAPWQSNANGINGQASPAVGPVIDINTLPRYGMLAPPISRQPRAADKQVAYDRATGIFTRNRGMLREALENKNGWLEDAPTRMWSEFARRQQQRYVGITPDANRRVLPETQGYRLRILRVNDLPMHTTYDGRTFEFQLGVTLYDEAYGLFYGNTIYSQGDTYDHNRAAQRNALDLDFSFDVFFHSRVSDPRCMAVVEVIMMERLADGVVKGRYSLGWALLPLFRVTTGPEAVPIAVAASGAGAQPLVVPMVAGTPRYLLMRHVYNEELRAPKVLQSCSVVFQAEAYPAMDTFIPLLPPDFLVSYGDCVPGLRRFDTAGQLSVTNKQLISTMANPMLCPTHSVVLRRLQLALPTKLHELLLTLDTRAIANVAQPSSPRPAAGQIGYMPGMATPIDGTSHLRYTVRVSVHNGRTFVGPSYELNHITTMDVPGWKVLQVPSPDAVVDYVMGDVMTVVVVELIATPAQAVHPGSAPVQCLVGWTAFVPFTFISDDGTHAEVAVGVHRYALSTPPGAPMLRHQTPLNWRALLGDSILRDIPEPMVEFQLFETGRTPIPPPLRCRFATIQAQRAHEESLGERPLEQVMAPITTQQAPVMQPPPQLAPHPPSAPYPTTTSIIMHPEVIRSHSPTLLAHGTQTSQDGRNDFYNHSLHREKSQAINQLANSKAFDTADREQLKEITNAMQRQIELLTRAVDDLKEERKTLRTSIISLNDRPPTVVEVRSPVPTPIVQQQQQPLMPPSPPPAAHLMAPHPPPQPAITHQAGVQTYNKQQTPEEIKRLMEMTATSQYGDPAAFSGAAAPLYSQQGSGTAPSRLLLQQLYDAGMVDALPQDVQAILRQRGPTLPRSVGQIMDLGIEARDPRTASDFVIQFLAFRHHDALNAPSSLSSAYFTFQFYHFPPTTTDMAYLVQPHPNQMANLTSEPPSIYPGTTHMADDQHASATATRILMTNQPLQKGAGIVLKYCVDGSTESVASGQTVAGAAYEAHVSLAAYMANKKLSVDMWDGESLLQVGTAVIDLAPLLRQGRQYAEQLVEVPFSMVDCPAGQQQQPQPLQDAHVMSASPAQQPCQPTILSRGSVVVRLINIGREPRNTSQDASSGIPKNVNNRKAKVRVKAAWEHVNSPIAKELANGDHPDVLNEKYNLEGSLLQGQEHASRPAAGLPLNTQNHAQGQKAAIVKNAILERSHRKSSRVKQLQHILDLEGPGSNQGSSGVPRPTAGAAEDAFTRVQSQLLVDVASARNRNKDAYIRDQLRKNMITSQVVRPGYGEVMVYEHELVNPYSHEAVFEIRINPSKDVTLLTRPDEYRALKAAGARFLGCPGQPAALQEGELAANRIYLQPKERVTLPFKVQTLVPPAAYGPAASVSGVTQAPRNTSQQPVADAAGRSGQSPPGGDQDATATPNQHHVVCVEFISATQGLPVSVLELTIAPKPLVIDRTFRFYHSERDMMRQVIKLRQLPGHEAAFPAAVMKHLTAAASHPDVVTGTGGAGMMMDGTAERDEVYIKFKCGAAPEVVHFYVPVYADRLLAKPIEVWQVFVHALRKVDMRAQIGSTSAASVVVRGAASSRRVGVYTSHPDELQASPGSFVLVAGALTEMLLSYKPVVAGAKDIKVHLVDVETRELVYALIVAVEAQGPLVTRTFEMELPAGSVANKKISYTNPYQSFRTFTFRCNQPWLLCFTPPRLQLPAGATRPLGLTFDARAANPGILDILVYVNDEEDKTEECFRVRVRIFR